MKRLESSGILEWIRKEGEKYKKSWEQIDSLLEDRTWLRASIMRWMQEHKWDEGLIESIMRDDTPTIETVVRLVDDHGEREAYRRIMRFHYE